MFPFLYRNVAMKNPSQFSSMLNFINPSSVLHIKRRVTLTRVIFLGHQTTTLAIIYEILKHTLPRSATSTIKL